MVSKLKIWRGFNFKTSYIARFAADGINLKFCIFTLVDDLFTRVWGELLRIS